MCRTQIYVIEQEVKLEYFESPDEITEFVTVQKYCEANTCNCSPNRRDQTLDPNISGKKAGSRNTIGERKLYTYTLNSRFWIEIWRKEDAIHARRRRCYLQKNSK